MSLSKQVLKLHEATKYRVWFPRDKPTFTKETSAKSPKHALTQLVFAEKKPIAYSGKEYAVKDFPLLVKTLDDNDDWDSAEI